MRKKILMSIRSSIVKQEGKIQEGKEMTVSA